MMIASLSTKPTQRIDAFFKQWLDKNTQIPQVANAKDFFDNSPENGRELLSWGEYQQHGKSWKDYLDYLEEKAILSRNFVRISGELCLRPGYHPEKFQPSNKS